MSGATLNEICVPRQGEADGIATLDSSTKIPISQIPAAAIETYKGEYTTSSALQTAYASASLADYAYVTGTSSYWYWNSASSPAAWVNQQVTEADYNALDSAVRAAAPYIVGV